MDTINTACCNNFLLHKINKGDLKKTLAMFDNIGDISNEKLEKLALALAKEGIIDENCGNCKDEIVDLDEVFEDNTNNKEDIEVENERPRSSLLNDRERRPSS